MNTGIYSRLNFAFTKPTPIALACLQLIAFSALSGNSHAQQNLTGPESSVQSTPALLESILVTGEQSPDALVKPFSLIEKDALTNQGASSIGEALRHLPGMDTTGFGPNASRPIVRGQDSDRIKILRNSASTVDVSSLSFDHGVPVDPFSLTQVEVLRGPSSLAYGGNAVGGAVNLVDSRIAREQSTGINGELNLLTGGAAQQSAGGFSLDAGAGQTNGGGITLHLDGFRRTTGDLKTPEFTDPDGVTGKHVRNSSSKSSGVGFGASTQTGSGYIGVSVEQFNSNYGVPKSTDVRIDQASERYALEGEHRFDGAWDSNSATSVKTTAGASEATSEGTSSAPSSSGFIRSLKYRLAHTDYQHQEFEDGNPATLFTNRGMDGRLELGHRPLQTGPLSVSGTMGVQFENTDFSAIGDEAFVPSTSTQHTGLFYVFKTKARTESDGTMEGGLRTERVRIDAASTGLSMDGPVSGLGVSDGPAMSRSFTPSSVSLGYSKPLNEGWSLGGTASRVERAPSAFELFADGEHVATDAYEKGNPSLKEERGRHYELTAKWSSKKGSFATSESSPLLNKYEAEFTATAFKSQFSNYITLIARPEETFNGAPVFDFTAVPADFYGVELSYQEVINNSMGKWKPRIQLDSVRGERNDGGGNLPRVSPQRVLISLDYSRKGWSVRPELVWVDDSKGAPGDPVTEGYQLLNLRVAKAFDMNALNGAQLAGEFFANFANMTDELAYSASTISTVRNYTPLQGRSVLAGMKILF